MNTVFIIIAFLMLNTVSISPGMRIIDIIVVTKIITDAVSVS